MQINYIKNILKISERQRLYLSFSTIEAAKSVT